MKHRNAHAGLEFFFNVEALGRFDVFQVDAAQGGFECGNDFNQFVGVALGQLDVKHVDAGKFLEQAAFALHHRLARQRANVAQTQHGGAVGDHADQIAAAGVVISQVRVGLNVQAGVGHARRVSQCQVALVDQRLGGVDRNLAAGGKTVVVA